MTIQNGAAREEEGRKRQEEEQARRRTEKATEEARAKARAALPRLEARLAIVEADIPTKSARIAQQKNIAELAAIEKDADALKAELDGFADADKTEIAWLKTEVDVRILAHVSYARAQIAEQDAENRRMTHEIRPIKRFVKLAEEKIAAGELDAAGTALTAAESVIPGVEAEIANIQFKQFEGHYTAILDKEKAKIAKTWKAIVAGRKAADAAAKQAAQQAARQTTGEKLKPLESTAKFPEKITPELIEKSTVNRNIGGTTGARLVEIDGQKYVCKTTGGGAGVTAEHVRNEAAADMAYRKAGILVPECRVYEVDGRTYKLSQYIEGGKPLGEWLKTATPAQREAIRKELAQGYSLDALFSNWDVLGTAQDNVLVDANGHAWRIDNGSAFAFRAQGARKKAEEFLNREWPDEWRTLRTSSINKGVFDDLSARDIFHGMNQLDVDAAVATLPAETQKALAKPLAEMKQLAAREADYDREGFIPKVTSRVLETTYELSKEGYREEVPRQISLGSYGFCRSKTTSASAHPSVPNFSADIKKAAISINSHAGFGKSTADFKPNMASVKAALAHKAELQKLAATDKNAATLLGNLDEIEKAQAAGWHIKSKISDVQDLAVTPPMVAAPTTHKYTSLTDHLYDRARRDGVDAGRIADYFHSQGESSWNEMACRLKVLNLEMRGKSWGAASEVDVYYGVQANYFEMSYEFKKAASFYKSNQAQLEKDIEALSYWKSGTQLLLENSSFDGNHAEARFMYHMRTDLESLFGAQKVDGRVQDAYRIGACESGCPIRSKEVLSGPYVGVRRVPYSRVNSVFFMEPRPGRPNEEMYFGDGERECGADLTGLPVYAAGRYGSNYEIAKHEKKIDAAFAAFAGKP